MPDQLPEPTSPSVTSCAGAGGAPSVAADLSDAGQQPAWLGARFA